MCDGCMIYMFLYSSMSALCALGCVGSAAVRGEQGAIVLALRTQSASDVSGWTPTANALALPSRPRVRRPSLTLTFAEDI